jgi:MFS family permease
MKTQTKTGAAPVETSGGRKAGKGALAFILTVVFLDLLGLNILLPVQAYIVRQYNTDALTVGLLSVIYAAAQFIAAPILGRLSDRYGRRPVLLLCVLGSAMGYFMFGLGGALWVLFLSRLIDGTTGGNLSVAQAYIADVTPPQERAKNFALMGAAFGLGFILGPAIAGPLAQLNVAAPAFAAGILSLLSVAFGYFMLPESLPPEKRTTGPFAWREVNPLAAIIGMARLPNLGALLLAAFVFNFAFSGMANNAPVYTIEKFGAQPLQIGLVFTLIGIVHVITQGGLVPRLAPRIGEKPLALAGIAIQVAGYVALVLAPSLVALAAAAALTGLGVALTMPTLNALIANSVSFREQGQVAGVAASLVSLTNVFGPLWAGASYDHITPGAPYWTGALVLVLAWLLVARIRPVSQPAVPEFTAG